MRVEIRWAQIMEHLQDIRLQRSDWTVHCGCTHRADGTFTKCPPHAAGHDAVMAEQR